MQTALGSLAPHAWPWPGRCSSAGDSGGDSATAASSACATLVIHNAVEGKGTATGRANRGLGIAPAGTNGDRTRSGGAGMSKYD